MLQAPSSSNSGLNQGNAAPDGPPNETQPYEGLDAAAQEEIKELARTLTSQSSLLSQEKRITGTGDPNTLTAASSSSSSRSIFASDIKGVNPILLS